MQEYLTVLNPILTWIRTDVVLVAALVFLARTFLDTIRDPHDVAWGERLLSLVGMALVVLLVRRSDTIVAGLIPAAADQSIPPLRPMIITMYRWVAGGVATIGAVLLLRVLWERWSANPRAFTAQRAVLVAIGFGMAWAIVARVDAILVSMIRLGDPSFTYTFGP